MNFSATQWYAKGLLRFPTGGPNFEPFASPEPRNGSIQHFAGLTTSVIFPAVPEIIIIGCTYVKYNVLCAFLLSLPMVSFYSCIHIVHYYNFSALLASRTARTESHAKVNDGSKYV